MDKEVSTYKLSEGWSLATIPELCIIIGGGTPSKNNSSYWNGDINWASVKDIKSQYLSDTIDKITQDGILSSSTNIASIGDVILVTRISPGQVTIAKQETAINQDLKILKLFGGINPSFIYYLLKAQEKQFILNSSGTTVKGLRINDLSNIKLPLPPFNEQSRIVSKIEELFSELEHAEKGLEKVQKQLEVFRQSLLKSAFEGKLTNKIIEKGKLPKTWKLIKVSEICNVVRGGSPRPAGDSRYYNGHIPFLKVKDITKDNKVYLNSYEFTIKEAGLAKTRKISPNTLLLSNSGATLGVPKICMIEATMNDGIAAFLDLDKRSILYLYYFWLSKTRELRNINMGAAQPNLNTDIIKNYDLPYCSFDEQQLIVQAIESRISLIENLCDDFIILSQTCNNNSPNVISKTL